MEAFLKSSQKLTNVCSMLQRSLCVRSDLRLRHHLRHIGDASGGAFNRVGREARFHVRRDAIIIRKAGNNNSGYSGYPVCVTDGESHFVSYDRRRNRFFQTV